MFVGDTDRAGLDAVSLARLGPALIEPDVATDTAPIEILEMRGTGHGIASDDRIRMPLGPTARDRRGCPAMSIHQVDVALSAGRQAVERARLQQTALLVAQAVGSECRARTLGQQLTRHPSPYQTLRHHGGLEHAALIGAALSATQLGLPLILAGPAARIAADLAIAINARAADWVLYAR
jgi:nicotinate-nucleotide--dimethylbenzimidazole phosphoribosyltransferase